MNEQERKRPGPKRSQRRDRYAVEFAINRKRPDRVLTLDTLDQLDACADDEARRLLLGKSR